MSLLLQGLGGGEVPWNLVLYYEPALITASSRIRYVHVCACACVRHLCVCVCMWKLLSNPNIEFE